MRGEVGRAEVECALHVKLIWARWNMLVC